MRATCRDLVDVPVDRVLATLRDVEGWGSWLAPCAVSRTGSSAWEVRFELGSPRAHRVVASVAGIDHGVECAAQGELGRARATCTAVAAGEGSTSVVVELSASSDEQIPGTWWTELGRELLPRWVRALRVAVGADPGGTGRRGD